MGYYQEPVTIEAAKRAMEFYKNCGIPFKYSHNYYIFNERYRENGKAQGHRWPNTGGIHIIASDIKDKDFLKWEKKLKSWDGHNPFMPVYVFYTDNCPITNREMLGYSVKSPESIKYECDIDIVKNFVFTVKLYKESRYGDFDYVLYYDNEWYLNPVNHFTFDVRGEKFTVPRYTDLRKILKYMPTLGKQDPPEDFDREEFTGSEFSKHLINLATAIPQTPIGKMYTDGVMVQLR